MSLDQAITFRNCEFRYRCDQTWDGLQTTDDPMVRHCSECERSVHYCVSEEELVAAIKANQCVAIPRLLSTEDDPDGDLPDLVGDMQFIDDYS